MRTRITSAGRCGYAKDAVHSMSGSLDGQSERMDVGLGLTRDRQ